MIFKDMVYFHLKTLIKNSYFWQNIFITVTSFLIIQYQFKLSTGHFIEEAALRATILGIWVSIITSVGIINFQRFRGTYKYLVRSKYSQKGTFAALSLSVCIFGLLAFPISYTTAYLLGFEITIKNSFIIPGFLLYLISAFNVSLVLSVIFLASKNAAVYEGLISIPILLLSGLFNDFSNHHQLIFLQKLIPISEPIDLIFNRQFDFIPFLVSNGAFLIIYTYFFKINIHSDEEGYL